MLRELTSQYSDFTILLAGDHVDAKHCAVRETEPAEASGNPKDPEGNEGKNCGI